MTQEPNLGSALGAALEVGPSRRALAAQRVRVLAALAPPARARRSPFLVYGTCAALCLGGVLFASRLITNQRALRGQWQGRTLAEAAKVVAPSEGGETLSFSDGSRVELGASAEVSLSKLAPDQAHLELARGHVLATIHKGTGRAWTLAAGPYAVHVVGTQFTVDWDANSHFFQVNVREGKVRVTGKDLRDGGVLLGPGERLERQDPAPTQPEVVTEPSEKPIAAMPAPPADSTPGHSEPPVISRFEDDFRAKAAHGNYSAAMAAARRAGFDRLKRELPAKDLLLLANTARYAGSATEAHGALLKLRERFPGSPSAAHAALLLASQAEDRDKNPNEAERWLRTFLQESPQGELAAGARARLFALLLRRGARAEAEQVARDYLRLHPNGPHAAQAQDVLRAPR